MPDIPTHTITTPKTKTEVVVKDYITGFDDQAIKKIYQDANKSGNGIGSSDIQKADKTAIECAVISIGGNTETIMDHVLGLPLVDAKFIADHVEGIVNPKDEDPLKS